MKIKSKDVSKIKERDVREIEFSYFKFNFSFINNQYSLNELEDDDKIIFLKRMCDWSSKPIISIGMDNKKIGYELLNKSCFKKEVKIPEKFYDAEHRKKHTSDKFMVFRLYPNNNPRPTRIIGMFCSPVFYPIYFDRNHKFLN